METFAALKSLAPLAEAQRGLVTSAQASSVGVSRLTLSRMVGSGLLDRPTHGIYRMGGTTEDPKTELYAHWLALDPARTASARIADHTQLIAVSHRSAATLYGIGDLPARHHTFTASYRKQSQREGMRVHTGNLTRADVRVQHGMLVTSPQRTIADLYRTEPDRSHVADALADAIQASLTSRAQVIDAMPGATERDRTRAVDALLAQRGLDTESLARELEAWLAGSSNLGDVTWDKLAAAAAVARNVEASRETGL